jgi:type II secretory pathway component PulK
MKRMKNGMRRGSTLAVTLWAVVAMLGVVLVLAQEVRVESMAVANRTSRMKVDAAERGAEQWLLSVVEAEVASPGSTSTTVMEQRVIGDCGVWVLSPDPEDPRAYKYGLTDEGGKIDLNTGAPDMFLMLPGIAQSPNAQDIVDAISDWRDADVGDTGQGAEDNFYLDAGNHPDIPEAYKAKNAGFESVEELLLVKDITKDVLFGADRNHNGVIDAEEEELLGNLADTNGSERGFYPFVTVWGVQATVPPAVTANTGTTTQLADVNAANTNRLRSLLENVVGGKADDIVTATRNNRPFANVFDWSFKVGLSSADLTSLYPQLTANPVAGPGGGPAAVNRRAKLNVNTAAREALLCLPGLDESDAQAILAKRLAMGTTDLANISWLVDALPKEKAVAIGGVVTGVSKVYSADIVAVSEDGRAFRRVRVVIDGRSVPAKIMYRRDMMDSGWPLPADIRESLRAGGGFVKAPAESGVKVAGPVGAGIKVNQRGSAKS